MWFDSHCHLHICEEDAAAGDLVDRARAAGVTEMVTIGIDGDSNIRSVALAAELGVYASVGVHPNSATEPEEVAVRTTANARRLFGLS